MPDVIEKKFEQARVTPLGEMKLPEIQSPTAFRVIPPQIELLPIPREILFAASPGRGLYFKKPISLTIYREQEAYIAYASDIEEFGYGESVAQALDDFGKTICELYLSLSKDKDRLGRHLHRQFAKLNEFLEIRRTT
jgi:hypothetical protein